MISRHVILANWKELRDYALRLVDDLDDESLIAQPVAGATMNHPAWILAHLTVYGRVIDDIFRAKPAQDPLTNRYGRQSKPLNDRSEYPERSALIEGFTSSYDAAAAGLQAMHADRMDEPTPIARWIPRFPTIAHLPSQFFVKHMATHLGQLSAWRRAMCLPPV
ncbi:MAG: DinB family protein [Phycisphaeraceae bacterium]|nr:DinB family protein [Phycisphaeraceae bacterium]